MNDVRNEGLRAPTQDDGPRARADGPRVPPLSASTRPAEHAPARLPRAAFPALLVVPPLLTALLVHLHVAPPLAMTVVVVGLIVAVAVLERRVPFRRAWNEASRHETATDVAYIALASVPDRLARVTVEAGAVGLAALVGAAGTPLVSAGSLPSLVVYAGIAFVAADLGKYLFHRLSHERPWLFRLHVAHHQPARLSALNALRLHPANMAYNAVIDTVPLLLLGVGPAAAAVLATVRAAVAIVQHANLDLETGRQWVVNAPSYHRVHHDTNVAEASHNYGSTLLVWDRLFGTLRRAPAPEEVGVAAADHRLPTGYLGQLLYPLCGARLDTTCLLAKVPWVTR